MKDYLFRIQVTQQDSFRWRHKISFIKGQELLKKFCIQHAVSSPYNHQSNGEAEAYIKFVKRKRKTSYENIAEIYMSLLHIRSTPVSPDYQSQPHSYLTDWQEDYCQDSVDQPSFVTMMTLTMLH